jgi:ribonuclease HII
MLRAQLLRPETRVTSRLLARLQADPRLGAQTLADELRARREAERQEQRRLRALLRLERSFWEQGLTRIAGTDEVGMGPLAGPAVAAAVILPVGRAVRGVDDSKQLTSEERERLDREIRRQAVAVAIGVATVREIERLNIRQAGLLAMKRALARLSPAPELVLVDAHSLDGIPWPQESRIKADATIHCVSCASVVAKVYRDRIMARYDSCYPGYGFARHKGYGTPEHVAALERLGPSPIHRSTFHWAGRQLSLFG